MRRFLENRAQEMVDIVEYGLDCLASVQWERALTWLNDPIYLHSLVILVILIYIGLVL